MKRRSWLRMYAGLFFVVALLTVMGFARLCPQAESSGLTTGCSGDQFTFIRWSDYLLNWLLIAGVVNVVGLAIVFVRRRRPTIGSFLVWISSGLMIFPEAVFMITPSGNPGTNLLLALVAITVLVAIPCGVSLEIDPATGHVDGKHRGILPDHP